jgi:hypothetical protein
VEQVIADVELAEPEGYGKASEVCGLFGCAMERDVEVGPFVIVSTSIVNVGCAGERRTGRLLLCRP